MTSRITLSLNPRETAFDGLGRHLAEAAPGDQIVYHTGPVPAHSFAAAARPHHQASRCPLAQRPVAGDTRPVRDFEFIAIKRRQEGGPR